MLLTLVTAASPVRRAVPQDINVSDFQTSVGWATVKAMASHSHMSKRGYQYVQSLLAYTIHVETYCKINAFASQYNGAFDQGIFQGPYHFAHPDLLLELNKQTSSLHMEACQRALRYRIDNYQTLDITIRHRKWSADGVTVPGTLDIQGTTLIFELCCYILPLYNSAQCYRLFSISNVAWIQDFVDTYQSQTTRYVTTFDLLSI